MTTEHKLSHIRTNSSVGSANPMKVRAFCKCGERFLADSAIEINRQFNTHRDAKQTQNWWEDHDELISFARYFFDGPGSEIIDFFEKPWKWNSEYQASHAELNS
jgi:hypothetical protein